MRHEHGLIKYKVISQAIKNIKDVTEIFTESEDFWQSGASDLPDEIQRKLVEIDMLISRIEYASDVQLWLKCTPEEVYENLEDTLQDIQSPDNKETEDIHM